MSTMRGFDAAQRAYDNMTPDDSLAGECSCCDGKGLVQCDRCDGDGLLPDESTCPECVGQGVVVCATCNGLGWFDEDGRPTRDPKELAEEADIARAEARADAREDR